MIRRFFRRLFGGDSQAGSEPSGLPYWEERAQQHGARSVLDIRHTEEEMAAVTEWQKGILFPHLSSQLRGDERLVIDFGCGPGRFSPDLAEATGARVVAVDPIQSLLDLAPAHRRVDYRRIEDGRIPVDSGTVDVVWICLVLGTITEDDALRDTAAEIQRVLRPGGLIFLVENTATKKSLPHFRYRSIEEYRSLFDEVRLEHLGDYRDRKERISIMAGSGLAAGNHFDPDPVGLRDEEGRS